ncbi:MAG: MBL fold metallo-hydrolase [Candidatus Peregrinibacteria bacterium]|nr:MBL fold metallo-hydrolase [Candidatus Peregrinibacteria bacterium]MDZ4245176.1 MBL fold metallo-hydrolase [Candidatus Gracilibacteria bacterium]
MLQFVLKHINKLIIGLLIAVALLHLTFVKIPTQAEVNFLDIGQGDSVLIVTPELHTILIDGGPGETVLEQIGEVLPFFAHDIDLMVLTHPHRDHLEGLLEVIQRYNVHHLLLAGDDYGSGLYRQFLEFARMEEASSGLQIHFAEASTDIKVPSGDGEILLDIFHPINLITGQKYDNANNASIVIRMSYISRLRSLESYYRSFMFTGDCEKECEQQILSVYPATALTADILKIGHHGSRTSSLQAFLDAVSPKIAVIQVGADNQFEHPHPETLEKLSAMNVEVHRNDLEGRITMPMNLTNQ